VSSYNDVAGTALKTRRTLRAQLDVIIEDWMSEHGGES
jgi:hypothetical protein